MQINLIAIRLGRFYKRTLNYSKPLLFVIAAMLFASFILLQINYQGVYKTETVPEVFWDLRGTFMRVGNNGINFKYR